MHFGNYVITSFRRDNRQINSQNLYQDRYQHVCRKKGKRVRINVLCNGTCHDICQMSRRTSCCQNVSYCLIAAGIKQSNVIQGGQFVGPLEIVIKNWWFPSFGVREGNLHGTSTVLLLPIKIAVVRQVSETALPMFSNGKPQSRW